MKVLLEQLAALTLLIGSSCVMLTSLIGPLGFVLVAVVAGLLVAIVGLWVAVARGSNPWRREPERLDLTRVALLVLPVVLYLIMAATAAVLLSRPMFAGPARDWAVAIIAVGAVLLVISHVRAFRLPRAAPTTR